MCELAVMMVNRTAVDPYVDVKAYKAGDVITAQENNWPWGSAELNHPDWRIVRMPSITVSDVDAFLGPEPSQGPPNRMLQRRAFRLDTSGVVLTSGQVTVWDLTFAQLMTRKIARPPRADPNVLSANDGS